MGDSLEGRMRTAVHHYMAVPKEEINSAAGLGMAGEVECINFLKAKTRTITFCRRIAHLKKRILEPKASSLYAER
ncbi:hypothetical protein A2841_03630 [Candidatus Kaiserbacteria bacterium RIFCSPHIGHO2_01_FULL_48_10]|uniref:Uncharacterized protein n=1 Tax=Candidatus Kaiserbacteria bacterium RIFCSPHIGHO2_01_FULL_48_10 TaxID=1798476 RepID=A0A1F6C2M2_9BACT|nr:MAG: hypothetical protein A2841_03630 [Candidatus Kaiserbacteria bacterium RIFCSPHIGHO2_01_FULL_48_10]